MVHGTISNILNEEVVSETCFVCGGSVALVVTKRIRGGVGTINEKRNGGEVLHVADVGVAEGESMYVGKVERVQFKKASHCIFDDSTATIMLYRVFGGWAAA